MLLFLLFFIETNRQFHFIDKFRKFSKYCHWDKSTIDIPYVCKLHKKIIMNNKSTKNKRNQDKSYPHEEIRKMGQNLFIHQVIHIIHRNLAKKNVFRRREDRNARFV